MFGGVVFKFKIYDIVSDSYIDSKRMGTREAIQQINGVTIGEGLPVDEKYLTYDGAFTDIDVVPPRYVTGFQTHVSPGLR